MSRPLLIVVLLAAACAERGSTTGSPLSVEETGVEGFDRFVLGNSFRALHTNLAGEREASLLVFLSAPPSIGVQLANDGHALIDWDLQLNAFEVTDEGDQLTLTSDDVTFVPSNGASALTPPTSLSVTLRNLGPDSLEMNLNVDSGLPSPLPFEDDWRVYERDDYLN